MSNRISASNPFAFSDFQPSENKLKPALPLNNSSTAEKAFSPTADSKEAFAARNMVNFAANKRFAVQNQFNAKQATQVEQKPRFETVGGEWGRDKETGNIDFYRRGINPNKTEHFDQEYYLPDSQKYPLAANGKYVRLNPKGDLNSLPKYKDKPKPADVSQFDWQGFEWTDAARVPVEHIGGSGKVAFENPKLADNQLNALKRFVVDNNLVAGTWDEAKFQDVFAAKAGTTIKLEMEKVGEEGGKTVYSAKMNEASLSEFRSALKDYRAAVESDTIGGIKGQQEQTRMAADIGGALYETGREVVDASINVVQDTLNAPLFPNISARNGSEPNFGRAKVGEMYDELANAERDPAYANKPPIPRIETSALKYEFKSEQMRRGVFTGKVDEGIKAGDALTTATSIAAPVVAAKVLAPAKPVQELGIEKMTRTLPQGMSEAEFAKFSQMIKESKAGEYGTDIRVHGSRAAGKAKATSDIDVAIRVPKEKFDQLVKEAFKNVNPGSSKERTMNYAIKNGIIQRGEVKLSNLGKQLEAEFGFPDVDISVVREGGAFDQGPWVSLK